MTLAILSILAQNVDLHLMENKHVWFLKDLDKIPKNGKTVFSCFHCGGGSTMGYKLAGYDVLGGVEIDPEMSAIYKANHNPKHQFNMGVQDFNKISNEQLPKELFNLDILDGSPPCSSFSMSGSREKAWGKEKHFREGQAKQVLDDLFFHYIETANKLKPKIVVAENVKGLILGNAKGYVKQIFKAFDDAGYNTQLFLLNAAFMGVPQRRERTFFVARRKDLEPIKLKLEFNDQLIPIKNAINDLQGRANDGTVLTKETAELWEKTMYGKSLATVHPKGHRFNAIKTDPSKPCQTISASPDGCPIHWDEPRRFSTIECARAQSFPDDYNFGKHKGNYLTGMSVPPKMMEKIAIEINKQWLSKL